MAATKTVTANFTRIQHVLTVSAVPLAGGTVTGGGTYDEGSTQPITATPTTGWQFVNWTGTGITDPSNASTTVIMAATKTVTANFQQINPDANGNGILDTWEKAHFGNADVGSNAANDDPDGDGLSNLMEFALNTDPLVANASPLICDLEPIAGSGYLRLTLPKNPAATHLTYTVETCGELAPASWSAADTTIESSTADQLIVRDNFSTATAARRFIRLRITANP